MFVRQHALLISVRSGGLLMTEYAAYLGIDWADKKHDLCLVDAATSRKTKQVLPHTPQAIAEYFTNLRSRYPGQLIAVGLEQSRGPLLFALLQYDLLVLYPLNPTTLAKYREAFTPSRAKDDPSDAEYAAELLMKHNDRLKAWHPDDPETRTLRYLVEHRRRLSGNRTRISNRLTSLLKCYFPQVLSWFPDLATVLVCDFLLRWPALEQLHSVKRTTLLNFCRAHHSVRKDTLEKRVAAIKESVPLTTDRAIIDSSVLMITALAAQMKTTIAALKQLDEAIAKLCAVHPDFPLFQSLPGAGEVYPSRLLAMMGTQRDRWTTAAELACLSGIAPVLERSGQSVWIRWRYFCPKFMRQSFHEYAGESVKHSFWARAYYEQQIAKGKSRQAAVRALAYKWIRIIWKCWQTRTPYSEVKYLEALRKKGSSLLSYAAKNAA
jgi:transposase